MKKLVKLGMLGMVCMLGAGCATNRGIVDVRIPAAANPSSGKLVAITKVTDIRKFELAPGEASIPSLKNGEINDKSITARAIARKRNGYGKAMGDILLPEGRTVEDLVGETAEKALMEKGYVVAAKGTPQFEEALPVEIEIHQFWAWMRPGFWTLELNFEAIITASNRVVFASPEERIRGHVALKTQAAGTRAWTNTLNKGIEELGEQIKKNAKAP